MEVKLDQSAIEQLTVKAILETITPEQREKMIVKAIHDLQFVKDSYGLWGGHKVSIIERAMQDAIATAAKKIVEEEIAKTDLVARVKPLVDAALEQLFSSDRTKDILIDRITNALFHHS